MAKLDRDQLEQVITMVQQAADVFRYLTTMADLCSATLEETKKIHDSVKAHRIPGDYQRFVEFVAEHDAALAERLRAVVVSRFDMGRLWIDVSDRQNRGMLDLNKGRIVNFLTDCYGAEFKVRIKAPKESASI